MPQLAPLLAPVAVEKKQLLLDVRQVLGALLLRKPAANGQWPLPAAQFWKAGLILTAAASAPAAWFLLRAPPGSGRGVAANRNAKYGGAQRGCTDRPQQLRLEISVLAQDARAEDVGACAEMLRLLLELEVMAPAPPAALSASEQGWWRALERRALAALRRALQAQALADVGSALEVVEAVQGGAAAGTAAAQRRGLLATPADGSAREAHEALLQQARAMQRTRLRASGARMVGLLRAMGPHSLWLVAAALVGLMQGHWSGLFYNYFGQVQAHAMKGERGACLPSCRPARAVHDTAVHRTRARRLCCADTRTHVRCSPAAQAPRRRRRVPFWPRRWSTRFWRSTAYSGAYTAVPEREPRAYYE